MNAFGQGVLFGVPDEYPEQRRLDLADSLYDFGSTIVRLELLSTAFKRRHHVFGFSALNAFGEGVLFGVPDESRTTDGAIMSHEVNDLLSVPVLLIQRERVGQKIRPTRAENGR